MLEGTISTGRALALDMLPLPIAREDFIAAEVMAAVGVMAVGVTGKRDQEASRALAAFSGVVLPEARSALTSLRTRPVSGPITGPWRSRSIATCRRDVVRQAVNLSSHREVLD